VFSARSQRRSPGAKALIAVFFTARLKSCPNTKHHSRDYRNSARYPEPGFAWPVPTLACPINAVGPTVPLIWTALILSRPPGLNFGETSSHAACLVGPRHKAPREVAAVCSWLARAHRLMTVVFDVLAEGLKLGLLE
jgi:hypothetical protein